MLISSGNSSCIAVIVSSVTAFNLHSVSPMWALLKSANSFLLRCSFCVKYEGTVKERETLKVIHQMQAVSFATEWHRKLRYKLFSISTHFKSLCWEFLFFFPMFFSLSFQRFGKKKSWGEKSVKTLVFPWSPADLSYVTRVQYEMLNLI